METKKSKVALLSNVNIELLAAGLWKNVDVYLPDGYDTWSTEVLLPDSGLYDAKVDAVFLLLHGSALSQNWMTSHERMDEIDQILLRIETLIKKMNYIPVYVSNLDIPCVRITAVAETKIEREWEYYWYSKIQKLSDTYHNMYVFDLKTLVESIGREQFYTRKMWYMGGMPFSMKAIKSFQTMILQLLKAQKGKTKKCLALDLDNTLWGGVISEDGWDHIVLADNKEGARFYDFQKRILEMKNQGVILTILSKNNWDDVFPELNEHPAMVLKENDFVNIKLNWDPKPANLELIAKELNVGTDSFVYIDDNPVEQEQMRLCHPEVVTADFPEDTANLEEMIQKIYCNYFLKLRTTSEDQNKTQMYQAEVKRQALRESAGTIEDYIRSLNMEVSIRSISNHLWNGTAKEQTSIFERVVQLCGKTNQFNLTTKRYSMDEIEKMAASKEYRIYTVSVKDRISDSGIISVIILRLNNKTAYIDTFLMSCRVMGRFLEQAIIQEIASKLQKEQYDTLFGEFRKTEKNGPVQNLYPELGFVSAGQTDSGDTMIYSLNLRNEIAISKNLHQIVME